ncbi:M12 family metallopeptidase [Pseudarthrobacter sp. NamB4]|uniref:M12 family metallopeptidase n=1 Tax=Pseudarthrobacter sp. NamB4 TaxID=2576837 RepID=UPI001F100118|nr:M12 family metallopeptidase [Pseudarthrobacter sp. NamB4]
MLHYWFLEAPAPQQEAVRKAFKEWKDLGIGLEFTEVADRSEAEVRIAFDQSDGSWSYVGRDVLGISANEPTMNFGWDLSDDYGRTTAPHEVGHTLGLPHEHQNPFSGIVWDEPKVYEYFGGAPNHWPPEQTLHNVLRKIDASEVEGTSWDPDSVMEYWFPAGLIKEPARFQAGLNPPGGLSAADKEWVRKFFPALKPELPLLQPFQSAALSLAPGSQSDFAVEPQASRKFEIGTFGTADTVLVLFEEVDGELRFCCRDDDSGEDRNSRISLNSSRAGATLFGCVSTGQVNQGRQRSCTGENGQRQSSPGRGALQRRKTPRQSLANIAEM